MDDPAMQAKFASLVEARGVLKALASDFDSSVEEVNSAMASELVSVAELVVGKTCIPGKARVQAHTWAVTKAYRHLSRKRLALRKARKSASPEVTLEVASSLALAKAKFDAAYAASWEKRNRRLQVAITDPLNPMYSKQIHKAFKAITCAARVPSSRGASATWTNSKGEVLQSATGTAEVGRLVSSYTQSVSSKDCAEG